MTEEELKCKSCCYGHIYYDGVVMRIVKMGREIKRVSLDFDWPLHMPWKGFVPPYTAQKCLACEGSGYNPVTLKMRDQISRYIPITQEVLDILLKEKAVRVLSDSGYKPVETISLEKVNEYLTSDRRARFDLGVYDISDFNLLKACATVKGAWGMCKYCNGTGEIWHSKEIELLSCSFEGYAPPTGEGYQLWENVSEGSPISPIFEKPEDLAKWIVEHEGGNFEGALRFVLKEEWAPSGVMVNGEFMTGIQYAMREEEEKE
jgi:hypothetical protein